MVTGVAAALVVSVALPAAAVDRSHSTRVSPSTASVEVVGLSASDTVGVEALWSEFVASIPSQAGCLLASPPTVEAKPDMRPRAAYAPSIATLYVKPGDISRLVIFHELGHHLDFACGAAEEIGADLRRAQGIAASKPWWKHGDPVTWPAEFFANAVAISLGEESRHAVTAETVAVVEEWLGRSRPVVAVSSQEPPLTMGEPGPDVPRLA